MEPMSWEMREVLDEAIRMRLARDTDLTPDHVDQIAFLDPRTCGSHHFISSAYTPWGVASIEAAFRLRMEVPHSWDTKDRIRRDILENPHLHIRLKEGLLDLYERANWAQWHDSYHAGRIMAGEGDGEAIRACSYLTERMRQNLLLNLGPG